VITVLFDTADRNNEDRPVCRADFGNLGRGTGRQRHVAVEITNIEHILAVFTNEYNLLGQCDLSARFAVRIDY
jgi:hypothetical protein